MAQVRDLVGVDIPIGDGHRADVIGPFSTHQSKSQATPWIGYISDLQHRRMPELFAAAERKARDRNFRSLLSSAPVILVHSSAVRDDIAREFNSRARIVIIPFAPCPEPWWFDDDPTIFARYAIERPFFMCSNQFWRHKDHRVLFLAVAQARREGSPIKLLCTGATEDYRYPDYFGELERGIAEAGTADDISILGLIPKADQLALMRQATAIIQPSRFEGSPGGGSIHQAIALGKRTIVADLPVNREILDFGPAYFEAGDAAALLSQMRAVTAHAGTAAQDSLLSAGLQRRRLAGQAIKAAFLSAL